MKISLISITRGNHVPTDYVAPSSPTNDNINYVHRQGTTVGNWEPTSGNFVLNNGNTFEVGTDGAKVNIKAELNNLEIIELRLTNIYGGRDYHVDVDRILDKGLNVKVDKGTYRIDVRNRWETHIDPRPAGRLTVTW